MGRKKSSSNLGRSLIKERFKNNHGKKMASDTMLHTTEIQDGYDWGRLNLQSVTEESSFQEFLSTAELAGTEFQAEKLNIKFINPKSNVGILSNSEMQSVKATHDKYKDKLKIPRRPHWDENTTPDDLDKKEKHEFLEWRRSLAQLQEDEGILLTPYEKNLEFWRQLWRVVERSDVVVQIVDARNPLLFRCEDLEAYVKEVSNDKMNLILINKSDFLSEDQRRHWANYFSKQGVRVLFFSAELAVKNEEGVSESGDEINNEKSDESDNDGKSTNKVDKTKGDSINTKSENETDDEDETDNANNVEKVKKSIVDLQIAVDDNADTLSKIIDKIEEIIGKTNLREECRMIIENSSSLLSSKEVIELFKTIHTKRKVAEGITTIGLVGYPNVGKSSTINALMSCKKVSVSATPGKTKHFQTLYLEKNLVLCDCPGLVMPSFVFTKAEMILNGILPVDQMRDHVPPVNLVTNLIPRHVLEDKYGIMLPKPLEGEDQDRTPTDEELLNAYAYNRGFMTANGQPDNARAARYILKDFINGKLLFCNTPPNVPQELYHTWPERQKSLSESKVMPPKAVRAVRPYHMTSEDLDKGFFSTASQGAHTKGIAGKSMGLSKSTVASTSGEGSTLEKPWKQHNKHKNKGKKEKLRRVYAHLDQH